MVGLRRVAFVVAPLAAWGVVGLAPAAEATTVTGMTPGFGPVGRTVTITGSGFTGAKDVTFRAPGARIDAGAPTVVDDGTLRTVVPSGAVSGAVKVTDVAGTVVDAGIFYVQQPTSADITRSVLLARYPRQVTVRSVLTSSGNAVAGQTARLQHSLVGANSWHAVGNMHTTSSTGAVSWSLTPRRTYVYRVYFLPTKTHLAAVSPRTRIYVQPGVSIVAPSVAPILTGFRVTGRVRPAPTGGAVYLQRYRDGAWHNVEQAEPGSRAGHYYAPLTLHDTITYVYRLRRPSDATHVAGVSHSVKIVGVNRTLSKGMSGPDVTALQRRLRALHYDVGAVNGSFGFDTQHAVVAFQKVQSMTRDGVVGPAVWKRLTGPRAPHLLHPLSNAAGVEVDLTHQVLLYGVDGHVRRIFDASTGGGYTYTGSDGQTHTAITPTGHFHVVYKRDGWVTAPLGTLYRPAYFNYDGYAIHGETEVPSYPASHGCVRITVPAMDRFNSKLPVGLSVWIYKT